jgi:hypothetical protein
MRHAISVKNEVDIPMRMHAFGQMSQLVHAPATAHLQVTRKPFSAFRLSHARFRGKPCQERDMSSCATARSEEKSA